MYETEHTFAVAVVTEACGIARRVQERIVATGQAVTKRDRSPVTIADLAIQAVVTRRLRRDFPDDGLLAEEDPSSLDADPEVARQVLELARELVPDLDAQGLRKALGRGDDTGGPGRRWVLDPIDGTKGFLRGDQYAIALALVDGDAVVVGALGCPNLPPSDRPSGAGVVLSSSAGRGATERRLDSGSPRPIRVDSISDPSQAAFCESVEAAHAAHGVQARIASLLGIRRPSVRIDSQCKYGVVARGEASIYLRLPRSADYREKVWDHAAGAIVIEEAGGRVSDLDGRPLELAAGRYLTRSRGIVATNGLLHDDVLRACREAVGMG